MVDLEQVEMQILARLKERICGQLETSEILFYAKVYIDRHISKKNNRPIWKNKRTGGSRLGKSSELAEAENSYMLQLRSQANSYGISKPIKHDLWYLQLSYFKNYYVKGTKIRSKKVNDLSNLYELPQDCLQSVGIIEDDGQICSHDLSRRLPGLENYVEMFLIKFNEAV